VVTKFVGEYTHDIISQDKVFHHYSHRKQHRTEVAMSYIQKLSQEGITPNISRVLNVIYGSQDGSQITPQQCSNHIRTIRMTSTMSASLSLEIFQDQRATNPNFYFAMEVDHLGMMRSEF